MDTKEKLQNLLKEAMRKNDDVVKRTVRMALAAIKMAEIEKRITLDENAVISIIQKEIKSRKETILDAEKANRSDIINSTQDEINVLTALLPPPFTESELEAIVRQAIQEAGAQNPADMGKVMKIVIPNIQGRATNDAVSQTVKKLLS